MVGERHLVNTEGPFSVYGEVLAHQSSPNDTMQISRIHTFFGVEKIDILRLKMDFQILFLGFQKSGEHAGALD